MAMNTGFDRLADSYDRWYDTPEGRAVFHAELKCLRTLCGECRGRWLEVGVGTGRFASPLGIGLGLDPSLPMLEIAARRGIRVCNGRAESLPFRENSFAGILLALAVCFIEEPEKALRECARILQPQGSLLLGIVPADGPWGRAYERKKAQGHPIYSMARFRTTHEIIALLQSVGFARQGAAGTLFGIPDGMAVRDARVTAGISPEAGFLGLLLRKMDGRQCSRAHRRMFSMIGNGMLSMVP